MMKMGNDLEEIKDDVKSIKKILNGNGVPGLIALFAYDHDWITEERKFRNGLVTIVFRTVIVLILGYIAYMVGLKQP